MVVLSLPSVVLAVVAVACVAALFKWLPDLMIKIRVSRAIQHLPQDERCHWFFGQAPILIAPDGNAMPQLDDIMLPMAKKGHRIVRNRIGPLLNNCLLLHPSTVASLVGSGDGLLTSNGAKWSRHRRLLTNAFHFNILKPYARVYADCTAVFIDEMANRGESVDVVPYIKLLSLDILLRCIFGHETNCQVSGTHVPYVESVNHLQELMVEHAMSLSAYIPFVYPFTSLRRRYLKECDNVHKYAMNIITKRRAQLLSDGEDNDLEMKRGKKCINFIDVLIAARDEDGKGLTNLEIREEVDTFMFEGHDTTANAITWTLYLLAKHPDHQDKCREEVRTVLQDREQFEWDDLKNLVYLHYCMKESLRLYPPVATFSRELAQPKVIEGHEYPIGTPFVVASYVVHRNPHVWDNPEAFDPLRFTPENSKGRDPLAFIPFSAGPRNCIGQNFAVAEEKVVLALILHHFELSLDERYATEKKRHILLHPDQVWIKLKKLI